MNNKLKELLHEIIISVVVTAVAVLTLSISFEKSETNNNITQATGATIRG